MTALPNRKNPRLAPTLVFFGAEVVISLTLVAAVYLSLSSFSRCTDQCDFSAGPVALNVIAFTAIGSLLASLIGVILLRRRGHHTWWVPLLGIILIVVASLVSAGLIDDAARPF